MESRTIHQLLTLLRYCVLEARRADKPTKMRYSGLCSLMGTMRGNGRITKLEHDTLYCFIFVHRPNRFISWDSLTGFFYTSFLIKPRLQFLTKLINLTKP